MCGDPDECYRSLRDDKSPKAFRPRALVEAADQANPAGAHMFELIRYRAVDATVHEKMRKCRWSRAITPSCRTRSTI